MAARHKLALVLGVLQSCLLQIPVVGAHDFWIEPSTYRTQPNERVNIGLRVGDHFKGDPVARSGERIVRFVAVDAAGETNVVGRDGADPAGIARFARPGVAVVGYRSNNAFVELEGPKFEAYLQEKGLEQIAQMRADRGATNEKTREAYSRCSKALIKVGEAASSEGDRVLGFPFEIVAETNPYAAAMGDELRFRVLFDGRQLANAMIFATARVDAQNSPHARTDDQGRVAFRLEKGGVWLIAGVYMTPAQTGVEAAWQSYWASLTFELADRKASKENSAPARMSP